MRANWVLSYIAYGVFAFAVAATALAFAVLRAWESPVIPDAAPGYRYIALGYRRRTGQDFSGILSTTMISLRPLLPPGFGLGSVFRTDVDMGPRPHGTFSKLPVEHVIGDFLQALHVRPLAGRLISLEDQRRFGRAIHCWAVGSSASTVHPTLSLRDETTRRRWGCSKRSFACVWRKRCVRGG